MESTTNIQTSPVSAPAAAAPRPSEQLEQAIRNMDYDGQFQTLINFVDQEYQMYWVMTYYEASNFSDVSQRSRKKAAVVMALMTKI